MNQSSSQVTVEDSTPHDRPLTHTQKRFYASDQCEEARKQLQALVDNPHYDTSPSRYTDASLSFIERHLYHLSIYPQTNLSGYMSNLKLMTSTKHSKPEN